MSLRNVLKKASGLFVEFDDDDQPDLSSLTSTPMTPTSTPMPTPTPMPAPTPAPKVTVKEIVERTEGPNLDQISVPAETTQTSLAPGGVPNFDKVYSDAKLPKVAFGAEEALEVISSLPADLPLPVKRSTVQASLSAMGKAMNQAASVNTENIVADASRKLAALSAFEDSLNLQTKKHIANLQAEIQDYEAKISALNAQIAATTASLENALTISKAEGDKLDDVLEFFTLDIGASKNAPGSS